MNAIEKLPAGWDESQIKAVLDHYENQTEEEQAEEIEDALEEDGMTLMSIPSSFVDEVRELLARKRIA